MGRMYYKQYRGEKRKRNAAKNKHDQPVNGQRDQKMQNNICQVIPDNIQTPQRMINCISKYLQRPIEVQNDRGTGPGIPGKNSRKVRPIFYISVIFY